MIVTPSKDGSRGPGRYQLFPADEATPPRNVATADTVVSGLRRGLGPSPASESPEDVFAIGTVLGNTYAIRSLLGSGGMGQVYDALDLRLNRPVAVKVSWPNVPRETLRREAQVMAAFRHAGLVSVHAFCEQNGIEYIVMERLLGVSLAEDLRRRVGTLYPIDDAIDVLLGICEALVVLHDAGLAHRDLTPSNIMLAPRGRVVVMDYGVVRCELRIPDDCELTGTPLYMAPESALRRIYPGQAHLVDIYALGVITYELVTGVTPFEAETPEIVLRRQIDETVLSLAETRSDVPPALDALVLEMLAKSPLERPEAAEDVAARLRAIREPLRPKSRGSLRGARR